MAHQPIPGEVLAPNGVDTDQRDVESLSVLYRRYSGWLKATLRRRYGIDGEDVVQETYIRVSVSRSVTKAQTSAG